MIGSLQILNDCNKKLHQQFFSSISLVNLQFSRYYLNIMLLIQIQFLENLIYKNIILCMLYVYTYQYAKDSCPATNEVFEIELQHCGCKRRISTGIPNELNHQRFNETTCSKDAFYRGTGQKIVGLSLYGDLTIRKL